ncbi:FapA family protein [Deferribacter abyssi]|uniref:FapA family protein n=1 Tax=Deferribacter abyssi TaxID=213806 RepID=UPI003C26F3F1
MSELVLDRYKKIDFLATTPTGDSYQAIDTNFNRKVLLKTIPKTSKDLNKRFRNLISTAGQIIHPNVLTILDYGEDDMCFYLIQEFVNTKNDSLTLSKINQLDDKNKITILTDLIDALQFAKESHIIHKNLYLDSLFLTKSLKIKIDNFNLERVITKNHLISELGFSTFSPPFIPPEKIKGKQSTYLSDIFQLGCIIYTLYTGLYPFGEKINDENIQKIKFLKYPDLKLFPKINKNIRQAILACLKLQPEQRINSYTEILKLLTETNKKSVLIAKEPYNILELDNKLYLIINDNKISFDTIENALIHEGFIVKNKNKILEAINLSNGSPYLISDYTQKIDLKKFKDVTIEITPDKINAFITLPQTLDFTKDEIIYFLKRNNIKYGIDEVAIEKLIQEKGKIHIPVAKGKPPINGNDAFIIYFFEKDNILKPKHGDSDRVDYKETNFIQPVRKNDILCIKIPYTEGIDGIDIYGNRIKAKPGKDIKLPVGKNTYISSDGLKLISTVDGQITFDGKHVNVIEVIIIHQDVDYSVGNINYHGDVIINGDVLSGFNIIAGGNIKINGIVEGCNIISEKGTITIKGGIFGKEKAEIKALKKITAEFVQDATLICEGDIEVLDYVRNSDVICGGYFKCTKKTGTVHTCSITSSDFIEVDIAGTIPYTKTFLKITPFHKVIIKNKINTLVDKKKKLTESFNYLKEQLKKIIIKYGNIEDALLDKEYKLYIERMKAVEDKLHFINENLLLLENLYERSIKHIPFIKINKLLYTDVTLKIGNYSIKTTNDHNGQHIIKIENGQLSVPEEDIL